MKVQQDTQTLRHAAIRRYLDACSRIDEQHRRLAFRSFLLVLLLIAAFRVAVVANHRVAS